MLFPLKKINQCPPLTQTEATKLSLGSTISTGMALTILSRIQYELKGRYDFVLNLFIASLTLSFLADLVVGHSKALRDPKIKQIKRLVYASDSSSLIALKLVTLCFFSLDISNMTDCWWSLLAALLVSILQTFMTLTD